MYCIQNFGYSCYDEGIIVQSSRGLFDVDNAGVCQIIRSIPRAQILPRKKLVELIRKYTIDDPGDILDYFCDVLGIVIKTGIQNASVLFASDSERFIDAARLMRFGIGETGLPQMRTNTHVLAFDGSPDEKTVRKAMDELSEGHRLLIAFQVRNNFVIGSA